MAVDDRYRMQDATVKIQIQPGKYVKLRYVDHNKKLHEGLHTPMRVTKFNPTSNTTSRGWDYTAGGAEVWVTQSIANDLLGLNNPSPEDFPQFAKNIKAEQRLIPMARLLGTRTKDEAAQDIDPVVDAPKIDKKAKQRRAIVPK